jgi:hypothetical protein
MVVLVCGRHEVQQQWGGRVTSAGESGRSGHRLAPWFRRGSSGACKASFGVCTRF